MIRADLTVLLTTVDGLRHREADGTLGHRLSELKAVDDQLRAMASGTDGNPYSRGGMATKLEAARICLASGEYCWIADGTDFGMLARIFAAEDTGTLFIPAPGRLTGQKRWLAFFADPAGEIHVDAGAAVALVAKGRSLLPSGITAIIGDFDKGDTVTIVNASGEEIAVGVTNYSAGDLGRIKGLHSSRIDDTLGHSGYSEVIHRNNMALLGGSAPLAP
jgi:glutamate 5-kinase